MALNSRQKGCRGEREFRDVLRAAGFLKSHRGQQFCGLGGAADVVCPELPTIHFECKRVQAGNPYKWMAQATRDAGTKTPIVAHKRNHSEWLVILRADDFLDILRRSDLVTPSDGKDGAACQSPAMTNGND